MAKLYLLGGENVCRRSAKEVNQQAFEEAGRAPRVLVFPWARASFDKKYRKRKLLVDYFRSLGASEVGFVEYSESKVEIAQRMAASDVVYLTGGQASILIERLKKTQVNQLLKAYRGIIVGRSAGALALCSRCVTTIRSNGRVRIKDGLGLASITLKAHYIPANDAALKPLSMTEEIYAVPEKSALIYENSVLSAMGSVYVFRNGERVNFSK